MQTKSVLLVGVGGQGTILAAKLLTEGLMSVGYDVKMSEIHGMSQRGGSVSSQVRYGNKVYSPIIEEGGADILVAFEKMEALRWHDYLKLEGTQVINDFEIEPMPLLTTGEKYPENIVNELENVSKNTYIIKAIELSKKLGNMKVMNVILLGALVEIMNLNDINWEKIISENVKEKFVDINIKALEAGKNQIKNI
jgi:indolepyruvate ferredoxin oxidoreductase beta subunit